MFPHISCQRSVCEIWQKQRKIIYNNYNTDRLNKINVGPILNYTGVYTIPTGFELTLSKGPAIRNDDTRAEAIFATLKNPSSTISLRMAWPFKRYVFQWGWGVLFGLFEYNEGVRSNVGTCCNVMVPLQEGGGSI